MYNQRMEKELFLHYSFKISINVPDVKMQALNLSWI